jgi:putative membrane protein
MGNAMQIVRTILWVLLFAGLIFFSFFNWKEVEVQIWTNLVLETKVPALVIVSFLLGMIPTWLLHRGTKWRLTRRINTLEAATRMPQVAPVQTSPSETLVSDEPAPSSSSYTPNSPL